MDIKLEKKPWYIRYRYYLAGGVAFLAFLIYVVTLSLGPSKLRIEQDNIQIAEVKNGKFMEYVDVEGVIQPILTIKVNAREAGSVELQYLIFEKSNKVENEKKELNKCKYNL